jgi:hypothetical protein
MEEAKPAEGSSYPRDLTGKLDASDAELGTDEEADEGVTPEDGPKKVHSYAKSPSGSLSILSAISGKGMPRS